MPSIQQLRDRALALKIEKADNVADIADLNRQIDSKNVRSQDLEKIKTERAELAADNAEIEAELSQINARVLGAEHAERERIRQTDAIRTLVAALLMRNGAHHPFDSIVKTAHDIEAKIQASIPPVEIKDIPDTDHCSLGT